MAEHPGPVFVDTVGAQFLTAVLTSPHIIKERHDSLEFLNHVYLRHHVRVVAAVDRLAPGRTGASLAQAPNGYRGPSTALGTWHGRLVVPLGGLDRHSRATTHVTNESGELVPLFTASEVNLLFGGGLVSFAARALRDTVPGKLDAHLRRVPWEASRRLRPAGIHPQDAADAAFDDAYIALMAEFPEYAFPLFNDANFRYAFYVVTGSIQLVVAVDPAQAPTRIFSYCFERPLVLDEGRDPVQQRPSSRRATAARTPSKGRHLWRFWSKAGTTRMTIELGPIGGCERYQLNADAPFDTWFAEAVMTRYSQQIQRDPVDTSQVYRLHYTLAARERAWSGVLSIDLRSVFTGVARTSVYASAFLAVCAILGTARVVSADNSQFLSSDTDAGASLLLLFPGVAASVVASAARHTLTATVQFPMRFTLWLMALASFALATATAVGLSGFANVLLWCSVTVMTCLGAFVLWRRSRTLIVGGHNGELSSTASVSSRVREAE